MVRPAPDPGPPRGARARRDVPRHGGYEAVELYLATAKKYVQRVLIKREVSDRTQAAVVAVRKGFLAANG